MARKGIQKVKTGCTTCKIRKVKCDEAHPQCVRCVSTGRKCDGYVSPSPGAYSWSQLLRVHMAPTRATPEAELRAMSFFQQVVAPALARSPDGYLWTNIAVQVSNNADAARHAVVAISSLYETFREDSKDLVIQGQQKNAFAMRHYNEAIRHLRQTNDQSTVLLVCVLFVCIEFLRGDHESAIGHCRHGINILNQTRSKSKMMRDYMVPVFCRLSLFPYFFGGSPDTFPSLDSPLPTISGAFSSIPDAHAALNTLLARTIRFVRSADAYRLGAVPFKEPDAKTMRDQQTIESALDQWFAAFYLFRGTKSSDSDHGTTMQLMEMRWLISKIWIATCLAREETIYDAHLDKFRAIVALAAQAAVIADSSPSNHQQAKFSFEMGFSPLLAFVVIKCRSLKTRISALGLMKKLSLQRENLWDNVIVGSIGRRKVEVEHGLELDTQEELESVFDNGELPPEMNRIRDSIMQSEVDKEPGRNGERSTRRKICFLMANPNGNGVIARDDWVTLQPI